MCDYNIEECFDGSYNETEDRPINPTIRTIIRNDNLVAFQDLVPSNINEFYLTYKHYFFENDFKCFNHLISLGVSINIEDSEQKTPIFDAIMEIPDKHYRRFKYFIEKGSYLDQINDRGETPILYAVKNYKLELAYCLSRKEINFHVVDEYNKNMLHCLLSRLLKSHKWMDPLYSKFKKLLRKVLRHGVSPYEPDYKGRKPIDYLKSYPPQWADTIQKQIVKYYCPMPEIKEPE